MIKLVNDKPTFSVNMPEGPIIVTLEGANLVMSEIDPGEDDTVYNFVRDLLIKSGYICMGEDGDYYYLGGETMEETKIVLSVKGESALYLFQHDDRTEFVVAYTNGPVKIGDYVEGWSNGHYFYTLEDAVEYFKARKY